MFDITKLKGSPTRPASLNRDATRGARKRGRRVQGRHSPLIGPQEEAQSDCSLRSSIGGPGSPASRHLTRPWGWEEKERDTRLVQRSVSTPVRIDTVTIATSGVAGRAFFSSR